MKNLLFILLTILFFGIHFSNAQTKPKPTPTPELSAQDLEPHTYYFDIKDGKFVGEGHDFLKKESAENQYFLLGEYHNRYRISEFTKALIPVLHDNGYRYFGLEIGPVSNQILTELSMDSDKTLQNLHKFNSRYYAKTSRRTLTPIPFFGNTIDAEFLAEATKRKWKLIGLDQEFSYSYIPLLDRMYENLNEKEKLELKNLHSKAVELVKQSYKIRRKGGRRHVLTINESEVFHNFLRSASENNPKNQTIAEALRRTIKIYLDYANRRWYANNSNRIDYIKENLREGFIKTNFDLKKDKMLLKMGGVHTGKGFSPLSLFDVGNTLHELARFHGNDSIHVNFRSRFYVDETGKEIDTLADKNAFVYRFKVLLQMAKKDQWTIIDLRPMRAKYLHYNRNLDIVVLDLFKLHDVIIIPKLERAAKRNFRTDDNN